MIDFFKSSDEEEIPAHEVVVGDQIIYSTMVMNVKRAFINDAGAMVIATPAITSIVAPNSMMRIKKRKKK